MGEKDLQALLANMNPVLDRAPLVICSVKSAEAVNHILEARGCFVEFEGVSLLLPLNVAKQAGFSDKRIWNKITLNVHSDLKAVGFLAALLPALAQADIGVNVYSAFYHDHLLVPSDCAEQALNILLQMEQQVQRQKGE